MLQGLHRDPRLSFLAPTSDNYGVLACETGGRWGPEACGLVDRLLRLRALRAPPAVRRAAEAGAASGGHSSAPPCSAPSLPLCLEGVSFPPRVRLGEPDLADVLALAGPSKPSLLSLRG